MRSNKPHHPVEDLIDLLFEIEPESRFGIVHDDAALELLQRLDRSTNTRTVELIYRNDILELEQDGCSADSHVELPQTRPLFKLSRSGEDKVVSFNLYSDVLPPMLDLALTTIHIAVSLPDYIWLEIATLLHNESLSSLAAVDKARLGVVRTLRFGCVTLTKAKSTRELMKAIAGDPFRGSRLAIPARIRKLVIRPWFIQPVIKQCGHTKPSRIQFVVYRVFDKSYETRMAEQQTVARLNKYNRLLADLLLSLPSVTHYNVEWAAEDAYHPEFFETLTGTFLESRSANLSHLHLELPLERFKHIAVGRFSNLKSLGVQLHSAKVPSEQIRWELNGFMTFLRNLSQNLTSLSVGCSRASKFLDISTIFDEQLNFAQLRRVAITLPYDGRNLGDPNRLRRFLQRHQSTITSLHFRTTRHSEYNGGELKPQPTWVRECLTVALPSETLEPIHFRSLDTVELALRPLRIELSPVWEWLQVHRCNLQSVTLTERALHLEDLVNLLDVLDPTLKVLSVRMHGLVPEMIEHLLNRLPTLKSMALQFSDIGPPTHPGFGTMYESIQSLCDGLLDHHKHIHDSGHRSFLEVVSLKCSKSILEHDNLLRDCFEKLLPGVSLEIKEDEDSFAF
ncbi:hypothetical protein DL96DRAFT_1286684 [Flagelloscypha sp. PMI_526]|nr:hypothetical protein DL96DRAFT_1286684 [Flagelloscypha sp. PMI_526]